MQLRPRHPPSKFLSSFFCNTKQKFMRINPTPKILLEFTVQLALLGNKAPIAVKNEVLKLLKKGHIFDKYSCSI
jgi:hypothetical protein